MFIIEIEDEMGNWIELPTIETLGTFDQAAREFKLARWEYKHDVRLVWATV